MTNELKNGRARPSKVDQIIDEAFEQSDKHGVTAQEIFVCGLGTALLGLALLNIGALPGSLHAMGSVMVFVGVVAMVLIRRKL
ncbi:hypothetical protein BH10PSE16_BH10PSE16_03880 [soil metagenome]